jgi:hypothetical protein
MDGGALPRLQGPRKAKGDRDDRIAQLLKSLDIGNTAAAVTKPHSATPDLVSGALASAVSRPASPDAVSICHAPHAFATPAITRDTDVADDDLSRVPTALASAPVPDLNSSTDLFLYAEAMAQAADADPAALGKLVLDAESRLPSRQQQRVCDRKNEVAIASGHGPRSGVQMRPSSNGTLPRPSSSLTLPSPPPPPARQRTQSTQNAPSRPQQRELLLSHVPQPLQPPRAQPRQQQSPEHPPMVELHGPRPLRPPRGSNIPAPSTAERPQPATAAPRDSMRHSVELADEERRLRASLVRLDTELEARRLNSAGSRLNSAGSRISIAGSADSSHSRAQSYITSTAAQSSVRAESAPERAPSRLASRLRIAAAAAAACPGVDTVPCKAHGLVQCKLCAAAATRPQPPRRIKSAKARGPVRHPPPGLPPQQRARSAGPTSYVAMRLARDVLAGRRPDAPVPSHQPQRPFHLPPQPNRLPPAQQPQPPPQVKLLPVQQQPALLPPPPQLQPATHGLQAAQPPIQTCMISQQLAQQQYAYYFLQAQQQLQAMAPPRPSLPCPPIEP